MIAEPINGCNAWKKTKQCFDVIPDRNSAVAAQVTISLEVADNAHYQAREEGCNQHKSVAL